MSEKEIFKPGNMLYPLPAVMVSCADKSEKFENRVNKGLFFVSNERMLLYEYEYQ